MTGQPTLLWCHAKDESCRLSLPPSEREVSVRGFMIPASMLDGATVRLDVADTSIGTIAVQCLSNPMERGE